MITHSVKITQGGRMVLPAQVRKSMNLVDGEMVVLEVEGTALRVIPLRDRLAHAQATAAAFFGDRPIVDEFLAERRQEAVRENQP
jgi:AbrB family looped-hinge helix DNA binding protein